jgi:anti-sigma regulatory factor (Ser/Thr protein kinase)
MAVDQPSLWEMPAEPGALVTVEYDIGSAIAVLSVRGSWGTPLWHDASLALRKAYAEHPESLILDLTALDDPLTDSAPTWMAAQGRAAAQDPPIRLALCVSPDHVLAHRLQSLGVRRFLPVYARVQQARIALASGLPLTDRLVLTLRPTSDASWRASTLVADACRAWELTRLADPACVVVSELVHNAVEHAGTPITLAVSRRRNGVSLAVSDGSRMVPRMAEPPPPRSRRDFLVRGRGLRLVHLIAFRWGAMPTADGKVVWATVLDG